MLNELFKEVAGHLFKWHVHHKKDVPPTHVLLAGPNGGHRISWQEGSDRLEFWRTYGEGVPVLLETTNARQDLKTCEEAVLRLCLAWQVEPLEGFILNRERFNRAMEQVAEQHAIVRSGKPIHVSGFFVRACGDSSVGIPDSEWRVEGQFIFDSQVELNEFKIRLVTLFEDMAESKPGVETYEEHQAYLDAEDELYAQHPDNEPLLLTPEQQQAHDLFPDNKEDGWREHMEQRIRRAGALAMLRHLQKVGQ